jgi:hypothetical protein
MPYAAARRRLSASAIGTLPVSQSRISPVVGDCVVEPVGLEPTTKVLWNMGGVRPAHLVGHPCSRSKSPLLMGFSTKEESPEILL